MQPLSQEADDLRNLTIADAPETFQRKVTQNKEESKEIGGKNENEHSS